MDYSTPLGLRLHGLVLRKLKTSGLKGGGNACKTFIFLGQHIFKRSRFAPLGETMCAKVRIASRSLFHTSFIKLMLSLSLREWIIEQPRSSLLPYVDHFAHAMRLCEAGTVQLDHGAYDYDDTLQTPLKLVGTPDTEPNRRAYSFQIH